jgi:hypothetical protein
MFNSHGTPVGAQITNYLLEKVRSLAWSMDIADVRRTESSVKSPANEISTFSTSSPRAPRPRTEVRPRGSTKDLG